MTTPRPRDASADEYEHVSLCEALDRILNKGAVVFGELTISVADVDLIYLGVQLVLASIETARGGPDKAMRKDETKGRDDEGAVGSEDGFAGLGRLRQGVATGKRPVDGGVQSGGLQGNRLDIGGENAKNGLGQLVLTLVKLVHELLEQQAIRRIEAGSLGEQEMERLGLALMRQGQEIDRLRKEFGLEEDDLNLDLGPLGRLF